MFDLIQVKSLSGLNYVRANKVVAIQTSATGTGVVVLEGGVTILSSETAKDIAKRFGWLNPDVAPDDAETSSRR